MGLTTAAAEVMMEVSEKVALHSYSPFEKEVTYSTTSRDCYGEIELLLF